jgi:Uma2 family endonuclease
MALPSSRVTTIDEYLAFDRAQPARHEYDRGRIIQQAGGSQEHALIAINLSSNLHQQLRTRACTVYGSDMRVGIPQLPRYVYPDVSVACGESIFSDARRDALLNPILIIEVLSPSTERNDRGRKFQDYQQIESFQEYVLVAQESVLIEHFTRQSGTIWTFEVLTDRASVLHLASIGCDLLVSDIYEKVLLIDSDQPPL